MTEDDWLNCTDPHRILEFLLGEPSNRLLRILTCGIWWPKASNRKLRLFGCGIWRRTVEGSPSGGAGHLHLLDLAERYSDGTVTKSELVRSREAPEAKGDAMKFCLSAIGDRDMLNFSHRMRMFSFENPEFHGSSQIKLLQYLFGPLLFRDILIIPAWLTWNEKAVVKLAQVIYDDRAFERLPSLANVLEEAGCQNSEILDHCRGAGPHIRGCWVIDLILGKK